MITKVPLGPPVTERLASSACALGASTWTLAGVAVAQALGIGLVGGLVGVGLTVTAAAQLDRVAVALVGFEGLVRPMMAVLAGGFAIAFLTSLVSAVAAAWKIRRRLAARAVRVSRVSSPEKPGRTGSRTAPRLLRSVSPRSSGR